MAEFENLLWVIELISVALCLAGLYQLLKRESGSGSLLTAKNKEDALRRMEQTRHEIDEAIDDTKDLSKRDLAQVFEITPQLEALDELLDQPQTDALVRKVAASIVSHLPVASVQLLSSVARGFARQSQYLAEHLEKERTWISTPQRSSRGSYASVTSWRGPLRPGESTDGPGPYGPIGP